MRLCLLSLAELPRARHWLGPFGGDVACTLLFSSVLSDRGMGVRGTDRCACPIIQYALSAKTLQPASMPHHYTRLVEAFDKSARGIARPWWKIFFNIW